MMKMNKKNLKALVCAFACSAFVTGTANATSLSEYRAAHTTSSQTQTTDASISAAAQASIAQSDRLQQELDHLTAELGALKDRKGSDVEEALRTLAARLADVEASLRDQADLQFELMQMVDKGNNEQYGNASYSPSGQPLVNPNPYGKSASYTQDAANAQGNSTMTFSYAPDQLYKVYCRTGYLTDIELKKGEQITFVGGGDTSSWAVNATTVAGVPHIYVKPVVQTSTTNLIINTNKRSYQLILTVSDWYNPMVRWSYGIEDAQTALIQQAKDEQTIAADMSVTSVDKLNFSYKCTVKGNKNYLPETVFDDGEKTVIRMHPGVKLLPALFIREPGKKDLSLANFKARGNCYTLDRVIDRAELRFGERDIVTIERKK